MFRRTLRNDSGFTLLEIAISLAIIGIVMSVTLPLLGRWVAYEKRRDTLDHMLAVKQAMAQYYFYYGHYPCPGPRVDLEADIDSGKICGGSTKPSRLIKHNPDFSDRGIFVTDNAVEGGVPFRLLNIPKEDAYDGWHNLLTYAVSAGWTDPKVQGIQGKIAVIDRGRKSLVDPAGSAIWVLVSHGNDGAGSYDGRTQIPCIGSHADGANCQHDGTYMMDDYVGRDGPNHFDDYVLYRAWPDLPPDPYAQYCSVQNPVDPGAQAKLVLEGVFIRQCGKTNECKWMVCHNGHLVQGVNNMDELFNK